MKANKPGNGKKTQEYQSTKKCPYPAKGLYRKNGKLYERVVESYMIRDILIPDHKGNVQQTYFHSKDYNKINYFANKVKENSEEQYIKMKKEQNKQIEASSKRVDEFRRIDMERAAQKDDLTRTDLQEEDERRVDYSLKRAKELLMNQKDEMKMCNKYIIEAKCQQIRKDQISEQKLIREEEKKLLKQENDMMVQKMMDDVVTYEKEREALAKKKKLFVEGINSQIKENHLRRQIEQEKINEEGRLNREASCQEMLNAVEERNRKKIQQMENVKSLNDYNKNVIKYMKAVENEENIIEERKIKEYLEEKERKEKEILANKMRLKKEKEKLIGEMTDRQMKSKEDEELREAIHTQYVQDLVERQWRQKEREALNKKMMQKREMMEGREKQKQRKNELTAAETIAEKEEFNARLKILDEQLEKERKEAVIKRAAANKHRIELLNQVYEKEMAVIEERKKKFLEAKEQEAARGAEMKEIRDHLERKINALSEYNLPHSCQVEIRRKLHHILK